MGKKLSQEIFNSEFCPPWAQYAAINSWGTAFFFKFEPHIVMFPDGSGYWNEDEAGPCVVYNDDKSEAKFDASDWKNSLIEKVSSAPQEASEALQRVIDLSHKLEDMQNKVLDLQRKIEDSLEALKELL